MRIKIRADLLRDALSKVLTVVDKKNSRPILTYCLIKTHPEKIEIIASDLEISAKILIRANVENQGSFCINAKNIFDILKELPDEDVDLEIKDESNLLRLSCSSIKYSLLVCGAEEFPQLNFNPPSEYFNVTAEEVVEFINKTSHAISNDETRLYLNGIFLQEINSKLRAVATDGYRLALIENTDFSQSHPNLVSGIIVPRKGVGELKKIADYNPEGILKIAVDESFIYVNANDEYYLTIRLIAREYPKYQAVIPSKTTYTMQVNKDVLLTAVKRVKLLANEKSNGIRFSLSSDNLTISANHPSLGDATEKIGVSYKGKDMSIGLNAKYLIDTFSIFDDTDVSFEFNNELSPLIVKSQKLPRFLGVIMPLKL